MKLFAHRCEEMLSLANSLSRVEVDKVFSSEICSAKYFSGEKYFSEKKFQNLLKTYFQNPPRAFRCRRSRST